MENATKALEMASGVLIALLIIGLCSYMYNNLSEEKNIEEKELTAEQAANFNESYEVFNKAGLQGSEILSLANKIIDYNKKEADKKGYNQITLNVILNNSSTLNSQYFAPGTYSAQRITTEYLNMTSEINNIGKQTKEGKKISEWAKKSSTLIPSVAQNLVEDYKELLNDRDNMARKVFKIPTIEYEEYSGRIKKMTFVEGK